MRERRMQWFLSIFFVLYVGSVRGQGGGSQDRVAGGEEAPIGRFPYMCSLRRRGFREHLCGGTLINPLWILTTAHCVDPSRQQSVGTNPIIFCGIHDIEEDNAELTYRASNVTLHPSWTGNTADGYDIALITLNRAANVVLPELPSADHVIGRNALLTVVGWGETPDRSSALKLQFVNRLNLVTFQTCTELYGGDLKQDIMICAGIGVRDACRGDSGGPLLLADMPRNQIPRGQARFDLVVGITSFGGTPCGSSDKPGVYTAVGYFREWIDSTIAEMENADPSPEVNRPQCGSSAQILNEAIEGLENKNAEALQSALDCGLNPDARYNDSSVRNGDRNGALLHWAMRYDCSECAKVLIAAGADVELENNLGETPLFEGGVYPSIDVAQILLDGGAKLESRAANSDTPLLAAAFNGLDDFVQFLVDNGADVDAAGRLGWTALHYAAYDGHLAVAKILIENGANVNAENESGERPLENAAVRDHADIAQALIDAGADVNAEDNIGEEAIIWAGFEGNVDVLRVLIESGADLEAVDQYGNTALNLAAEKGHADAVKVLLESGADIQAVDNNGEGSLHGAAVFGQLEVIKVLLDAGASKTVRNDRGDRPEDVVFEEAECTEETRSAIVDLLFT